jgi:hypothetical protein
MPDIPRLTPTQANSTPKLSFAKIVELMNQRDQSKLSSARHVGSVRAGTSRRMETVRMAGIEGQQVVLIY